MGKELMDMGTLWDSKFSREGYLYGLKPNAYLVSKKSLVPSGGTILFLGEGEGRNACYFAKEGFICDALDASAIGLAKTAKLASEMGVEVSLIHQDLGHWKANKTYDAVMASYLHLKDPLRTKAFLEAINALKPSACFIAEFFALSQLGRTSGGPAIEDLLYTKESLADIFKDSRIEILELEELEVCLDEGTGHQGDAMVIRLVVRKK